MIERSVAHATFVVERIYDASPARVFAAWGEPEANARWAAGPDADFELDFRIGGREFSRGSLRDGSVYTVEARYHDIVPNERIIYTYDMHLNERRISVSLGTVELKPDGDRTRLTFTEQGAYLDGLDTPEQREQGTATLLDALADELRRGKE